MLRQQLATVASRRSLEVRYGFQPTRLRLPQTPSRRETREAKVSTAWTRNRHGRRETSSRCLECFAGHGLARHGRSRSRGPALGVA